MIANINGEPPTRNDAEAAEDWGSGESEQAAQANEHFDRFELEFFQRGDDETGSTVEESDATGEHHQEARAKSPWLSRWSLIALVMASTGIGLASIACTTLWRRHAASQASSLAAASAEKRLVEPAVPLPSPVVVAEAPVPIPQPIVPAPSEEATEKLADHAATDVPDVASAPPSEPTARERCKQSIRAKRAKEILAVCPAAFAEDANNTDAALALARVEFDRGHFAQAHAWSNRAIAANPAIADAYVFAGGAEQNRGHDKAAKEAYLQYLRLAPSGRYAAELRTIVKSL